MPSILAAGARQRRRADCRRENAQEDQHNCMGPPMASTSAARPGPRWFVPGDLDGFLGLGLDKLIQILLILGL